jgi:uncharacterized protein (TIGR03382 family)
MNCDPVTDPEPQQNHDMTCDAGGASGFGVIFMVGVALRSRRRSRRSS